MIEKKYKVAFVFICLNQPYWEFAKTMFDSAQKFFLRNHYVDYFFWSDMPQDTLKGVTVIPTEPVSWPYPTLLRYNLFLNEEERLKEYDYIFYCDVDMKFVAPVGDEILGDGLTMAQHPMYAVRKEYVPPYEPNPDSSAYIKRPGRTLNGRVEPLYAAGGFQGGRSADFLEAMKVMKRAIDDDFSKDYVAIWNDESHWNKYLFDHPPAVVLSPSYVYPDSLVKNYYTKVWGRNYVPKLVTLTKQFTLTKEGGNNVQQTITTL